MSSDRADIPFVDIWQHLSDETKELLPDLFPQMQKDAPLLYETLTENVLRRHLLEDDMEGDA